MSVLGNRHHFINKKQYQPKINLNGYGGEKNNSRISSAAD